MRWYLIGLGSESDLHTPHWHGNTVLSYGHRVDVVSMLPTQTVVADIGARRSGDLDVPTATSTTTSPPA